MVYQLLLMFLLLYSTQAQTNCSDRCCYWYYTIPGNNSECHPAEGTDVELSCNIFVPHDINDNSLGTVSWFRSFEGDTVVTLNETTGKYTIQVNIRSQPVGDTTSPVYQLFRDAHELIIHNISTTDNGYYWCEIQSNETCFDPSPFVNISVNSSNISSDHSSESCASFYFGANPGICATRMCTTKETIITALTTAVNYMYSTQGNQNENYQSSSTSINASSTIFLPPTDTSAVVGSLSSLVVLLSISLFIMIAVFVLMQIRQKRKKAKCVAKNTAQPGLERPNELLVSDNRVVLSQMNIGEVKEYEDPEYCAINTESRLDKKGTAEKQRDKCYEQIDINKLDYVSVYDTPTLQP